MTKLPRKKPAKAGSRKVSPVAGQVPSSAKPGVQTTATSQRQSAVIGTSGQLEEVLALIEAARRRAHQAVNTELVSLYWELGG